LKFRLGSGGFSLEAVETGEEGIEEMAGKIKKKKQGRPFARLVFTS
jgi:hypothetical protein